MEHRDDSNGSWIRTERYFLLSKQANPQTVHSRLAVWAVIMSIWSFGPRTETKSFIHSELHTHTHNIIFVNVLANESIGHPPQSQNASLVVLSRQYRAKQDTISFWCFVSIFTFSGARGEEVKSDKMLVSYLRVLVDGQVDITLTNKAATTELLE